MFPARRPTRRLPPASPQHAPRTSRLGPWWRLPKRLALFATHLASKGGHLVRTSGPPYHLTTDCGGLVCAACTTSYSKYRVTFAGVTMCTSCIHSTSAAGDSYWNKIISGTLNGSYDLPLTASGTPSCEYVADFTGVTCGFWASDGTCTSAPNQVLDTMTMQFVVYQIFGLPNAWDMTVFLNGSSLPNLFSCARQGPFDDCPATGTAANSFTACTGVVGGAGPLMAFGGSVSILGL
jgi:hypothetical protein